MGYIPDSKPFDEEQRSSRGQESDIGDRPKPGYNREPLVVYLPVGAEGRRASAPRGEALTPHWVPCR